MLEQLASARGARMPSRRLRRREVIAGLGGAAAALSPLAVRSEPQPRLPVIAYVNARSPEAGTRYAAAFRQGLEAAGYIDGQNVTIEYHWLNGRYERAPSIMADLVRRGVAIIATPGTNPGTLAAKAATSSIPIVFGVGSDPVPLGLVASLARPGGNATGVNFFVAELVSKRLGLLHELVPKARRVAVLVNPANATSTEVTLRELPEAARVLGLQTVVLNAATSGEIDAAFASLAREPVDTLSISPDGFYNSRRVQFTMLTARHAIPAVFADRDFPEAGGLMSYGTDIPAMFHQVGSYCGRILKGAKPAELPVMQSTKFELVINTQTAKLLGLEIPATLLAIADEVIE
jgi:putative ABC transport system substrate-binding protein